MGELRLPGLATGIDTATLIDQLMAINSRRLASYQVKKIAYEAETTALSELRTKVNSLNTSVTAISNASSMEAYKANSSDNDVLGVSASEDASEGSHSLLINQLATTETWIQDNSTFEYETDYVGGGTLIYSYNHTERQITTVANETTLEDLVGLINNDEENPGITASLLYQGGRYHLMLSGQRTGVDYGISVNASSTEIWKADSTLTLASDSGVNAALSTKITELSQFGGTLEGGETIEITGTDRYGHAITQLDLSLTSNTTIAHILDNIEEAFKGNVKATFENGAIAVADTTSGTSSLSITLTYNANGSAATLALPTMAVDAEGGETSESLSSLTSTSFIKTQTAQNSEIKVDGYPSASAVSEVQTMSITQGNPDGGHYHLTYDGHTTGGIAYDAVAATIQAAIDALPNVNSGDITVTAENNHLDDGDIYFTFSDTLGDVPTILADDSALSGTGPGPTIAVSETTPGSAAWISNNSNTIADAITGITLFLQDVNKTNNASDPIPVVITLTRDISGVAGKVQKMVNAYNTLITFLKEKTEYNVQTKEMGLLSRSTTIPFLKTQLNDPFVGIATGFNDDDLYTEARDLGITVKGDQTLELDTSVLTSTLNTSVGFTAALELIGAVATGSVTSGDTINFYSASSKYTTAGTYEVEVTISNPGGGNVIQSARIRQTDGTWHDAEIDGNIITGDSTFDSSGFGPLYPENGLQLSVDLSTTGTFTDTVRVKKGFAGELEDMLNDMLRTDGRLDVSEEINQNNIEKTETTIANEEARLEKVQDRLIIKYARLEKTLTILNQQMAAVNTVSQATFG